MFDRTVDATRMKTKDSTATFGAFLTMTTKKNRPTKILVDKGTEFVGEFKIFCKVERIQINSTISEANSAFAERTIRSWKKLLYQYMGEYRYKYIKKLCQFLTTLSS